ncbi:SIR2 family protein [Jonesiaceae bacterium BS-20]|uniref:SIR2 family protein n=1 Tax=Jonesiaceae bacterium BS-20 TaxID=3120821 RepID=A0AAU7DY69_9MICO
MVRTTLKRVRSEFQSLADDLADGRQLVWLGSGISRDQVPDVVKLIEKVLEFLQERAMKGPDEAEHRQCLIDLLDQYLPGESAIFLDDPKAWKPSKTETLRNSYSDILGRRVRGKSQDYIAFEGAQIHRTYADPSILPGVDHKLVAILIAEEVVKEIASGNWDPLIERAVDEITGSRDLVSVYVNIEDTRVRRADSTRIIKFHGCAELAVEDPDTYRSKMIYANAQIGSFGLLGSAHIQDTLMTQAREKKSLFLGLSVQDSNLLATLSRALEHSPWRWESQSPAFIFAEESLKDSQRDVLTNAYVEYADQEFSIEQRSVTGAYPAKLLSALIIEVLLRKYYALADIFSALPNSSKAAIKHGLKQLADLLVAAIANDPNKLVQILVGPYSNLLREFQGLSPKDTYHALYPGPRDSIRLNAQVEALSTDLFATSLGLLGWGETVHLWKIRLNNSARPGTLQLEQSGAKPVMISIVKGTREADKVLASPVWEQENDRMALLYLDEQPKAQTRGPASRLGSGRGPRTRAEVSWDMLTDSASDVEEIASRLQIGIGL